MTQRREEVLRRGACHALRAIDWGASPATLRARALADGVYVRSASQSTPRRGRRVRRASRIRPGDDLAGDMGALAARQLSSGFEKSRRGLRISSTRAIQASRRKSGRIEGLRCLLAGPLASSALARRPGRTSVAWRGERPPAAGDVGRKPRACRRRGERRPLGGPSSTRAPSTGVGATRADQRGTIVGLLSTLIELPTKPSIASPRWTRRPACAGCAILADRFS